MKKIIFAIMIVSVLCFAATSYAQSCPSGKVPYEVDIEIEGPGGHSSGAYGRVNALHAASRSLVSLADGNVPSGVAYNVYSVSGGNSVNSIAFDAYVKISACADNTASANAFDSYVKSSFDAGIKAENDFRKVVPEQTDANGVRLDVRYNRYNRVK